MNDEYKATPIQHYALAEELIHKYHNEDNENPTDVLIQAQIHATLATANWGTRPVTEIDDEDMRP